MKRIGIVAATVALIGALGVAGIATGHVKRFKSTVSVSYNADTGRFTGKVRSAKKACRFRRVALIRKSGRRLIQMDTGSSNPGNGYSMRLRPIGPGRMFIPGNYFVVAKSKRIPPRTRKHRHICKPKRSKVVTVAG